MLPSELLAELLTREDDLRMICLLDRDGTKIAEQGRMQALDEEELMTLTQRHRTVLSKGAAAADGWLRFQFDDIVLLSREVSPQAILVAAVELGAAVGRVRRIVESAFPRLRESLDG